MYADHTTPSPSSQMWQVIVHNIHQKATAQDLRITFGKFGEIDRIRLNPNDGTAVISFTQLASARAATTDTGLRLLGRSLWTTGNRPLMA